VLLLFVEQNIHPLILPSLLPLKCHQFFSENRKLVAEIVMTVSCGPVVHHDGGASGRRIKFTRWRYHPSFPHISQIDVIHETHQFSHFK